MGDRSCATCADAVLFHKYQSGDTSQLCNYCGMPAYRKTTLGHHTTHINSLWDHTCRDHKRIGNEEDMLNILARRISHGLSKEDPMG
jgi:hypothetical protein